MTLSEAFFGLQEPPTGPARRYDLREMILTSVCAVLCRHRGDVAEGLVRTGSKGLANAEAFGKAACSHWGSRTVATGCVTFRENDCRVRGAIRPTTGLPHPSLP